MSATVIPVAPPRLARVVRCWTRVGGLPMHARVSEGPAPAGRIPVVLVHGQVVSSRYMEPTMAWLGRDFPVYAPDLPGFGESPARRGPLDLAGLADALAAWMDAAGLPRAALLGNSFGCEVAVELALRHPGRVDRLVLQGPTADPTARSAPRQIGRWLRNAVREPGGMGRIILRDYRAAGARRALRVFRTLLSDPIEDKLPRLEAPVLVVRGARDPIVPQRWAEQAAALARDGRLRVVPGAGHTMTFHAPLELSRVVRPFLLATTPEPHHESRSLPR